MTEPVSVEVEQILRIVPDEDDYDNCLAKVIMADGDCCDVVVLGGPHKGDIVENWPLENFLVISPLELLAEVAE